MKKKYIEVSGISPREIEFLKSLEIEKEFQDAVTDFHRRFDTNASTGSDKMTWTNPSEELEQIREYIFKFIAHRKIAVTHPYFYFKYIYGFMLYGKWPFDPAFPNNMRKFFTPPAKYNVVNEPKALMEDGKVVRYSETVSLVTYARLTTTEFDEAISELKEMQSIFLDPKLNSRFRSSINIDRLLKVSKEMDSRERPHKVEVVTGYLAAVKQAYERDEISETEYKRVRKLNPRDIKNIKTGKTSGDVAQTLLGKKRYAANARQMVVRLKKKQRQWHKLQ